VTPTDRPAALLACGLDAAVPDEILADLLAETTGADALTLRRGLALWRARELLVELAAHGGAARCAGCRAVLRRHLDGVPGQWCGVCRAYRRVGPARQDLAEALAAALADASRPGGWLVERHAATAAWLAVVRLLTSPACPRCGSATHRPRPQSAPDVHLCESARPFGAGCPWAGPAAALLPPLLSRAELADAVAARRATTGLASGVRMG
jgi:hypothetical protein